MHSHSTGDQMASRGGAILQGCGSEDPIPAGWRRSSVGHGREGRPSGGVGRDLTREDLLLLLSMMEGELQARDEAITVLKAGRTDLALLQSHYGFKGPAEVIRALHKDSVQARRDPQQDAYENPMVELDRLVAVQRRSFRRMLEQLLEVRRSHGGALCRMEEQERKHRVFIRESDDLTAMLEQDRERLKLLIVKEKEEQERKEEESEREVSLLRNELTKLKAFALLVVDEHQGLTRQLEEERRRVRELTAVGDHAKQELSAALSRAKEEELRVRHLEEELHHQASVLLQNQEAMTAKLANEDTQRQELRQQLAALSQQLDELEGTRTALRRAEEELRDLRDRVRGMKDGEGNREGTSVLLSEVEVLRRRVAEMEGRDDELIRMRDESRDLDRRIGREASQCRSLKAEVEKLNGRIGELEKLEEALGRSRQECGALRGNLERERGVSRQLSGELDTLKVRLRELEVIEGQLEKKEVTLRQDLVKLRTLTMALVEDRKSMAERLQTAEEKLGRAESKENNQNTLTTVSETLREERRQALRSKAELEERMRSIAKDREELQARLKAEEERSKALRSEVSLMRSKLQLPESRREKRAEERHVHGPPPHSFKHHLPEEDNKVRELSQEVEGLRRRLAEKEVVEGELVRAEEDFGSLEKRFRLEQDRSRTLMKELEEAKTELSRYQLAEKQEVNSEHLLLRRLQQEQVKSRLLGREVEALKDKVQRLMGTEESISKVQMDHSTLQRKLTQQEARNRELARDTEELTTELERYRRFSRSLRPGVTGRRFTDLHLSTKEVQTEPGDGPSPVDGSRTPFALNGRLEQESEEDEPDRPEELDTDRRGSTPYNNLHNFNHANNGARRHSSSSVSSTDMQQLANGEVTNANLVKKGDVVLTHTPGQPLHIKVTPDHSLNTATLEISSPTADTTTSFTSTAVIPTSGAPPKQRITIIQNAALSTARSSSPDRALSPTTPVSQVASLDTSRSATPEQNGPVQIVTVSTCSPEPPVLVAQAVLRMSPERENSWHLQRSNSTNTSTSPVITTEDNKIHIHLGSPYVHSLNGLTNSVPQLSGQYYSLRQEHKTHMLTNGCHVRGGGKITSSLTITPATSPVSQPSKIPVSGLYD